MRRSTRRTRRWHRIHAHRQHRRQLKHNRRQKAQRRRRLHRVAGFTGTFETVSCPEILALESNFDGVVKLIDSVRERSRRRRNEGTYIDFKPIRTVKPSGALVLAAELDRWNQLPKSHRFGDRSDVHAWDPQVRQLLGDMGFFDLLGVSGVPLERPDGGPRYVKFRRGTMVDGRSIHELRELDLSPFIDVPNTPLLFAAVSEAMTNVVHHAYKGSRSQAPRCWWLSAAHNAEEGELVILIYDQGLGIPCTVPQNFGERVRGLFGETDAALIRAAHYLGRSETGEAHRGFGLERDVRRYVRDFEGRGTYRVISGKGEYTVQSGEGGTETVRTFKRPLRGTLIEWRLEVDGH